MSEVKWIKLQTDIFDNRKIKQIERLPDGDSLIVIWLKILVLAGATNDNGMIYFTPEIPYTDQLLSTEFNRPLSTVQFALKTFERFGMIEIINEIIHVSNWERYQNVEGMEKVREQTRQRVAAFRERKALECNVTSNVTVTQRNATDIEEDKEIDKDSELDSKRKRFTAPTIDEVRAYCQERGNSVDPAHFIAHYEANGWKVGRNPMKDWKAAVRTWEKNEYGGKTRISNNNAAPTRDELDKIRNQVKRSPAYMSSGAQKHLSADEWDEVMNKI